VVGIVARAAVDLSALGRAGLTGIIIAVAALAGGILELNPLVVLAGGGVVSCAVWALSAAARGRRGASGHVASAPRPWLATVTAPLTAAGLIPLGFTFLKIGAVAFGSGYAPLPFLHADLVGASFHLTDR